MKRVTTLVLSLSCFLSAFGSGLVEYPGGRNQALIVGVSHGLPGLKNDMNNVEAMSKNQAYKYEVTKLSEGQGTRANIKAELGKLSKLTQSDGTLFFYFTGHGNVGNIYPQDGLMSIKDIRSAMEEARAEMGPMARLVMMFDSCHSGSLLDPVRQNFDQFSLEQQNVLLTQLTVDAIAKEFEPGVRAGYWQNLFVFASSRASETSLAGDDGSEFTNALDKAFKESTSATIAQFVDKTKKYTNGHHPVERLVPASMASEPLLAY